jgi:nitrate reductase cytochrome c-type subunit
MRRRAQPSLWIVIFLLPLLAAGASASDKEVDDGIDVYFRDVDLMALSDQDLEKYSSAEAGESKRLGRAFPDAPPQIPHAVEGMYPIGLESNECIDCHHPDNVTGKEDLPLPKSHFSRPVMGKTGQGEAMAWVVKRYEYAKDVVGSRYDCSMCHTPQATNVDTPASSFVRVERKSE